MYGVRVITNTADRQESCETVITISQLSFLSARQESASFCPLRWWWCGVMVVWVYQPIQMDKKRECGSESSVVVPGCHSDAVQQNKRSQKVNKKREKKIKAESRF